MVNVLELFEDSSGESVPLLTLVGGIQCLAVIELTSMSLLEVMPSMTLMLGKIEGSKKTG